MSRKPSFANLRDRAVTDSMVSAPGSTIDSSNEKSNDKGSGSRQGRKQIAGFFTPEMSFAMHMLARRRGRSLQDLMAEAFNDVLRKHGESPIGE